VFQEFQPIGGVAASDFDGVVMKILKEYSLGGMPYNYSGSWSINESIPKSTEVQTKV
jgi:hypothetical protein